MKALLQRLRSLLFRPGRGWRDYLLLARVLLQRKLFRRPVILLERPAGIGDILCAFPAAIALREQRPGALLLFGTRAEFRPLVRLARVADAAVTSYWFSGAVDEAYKLLLRDELKPPVLTSRRHLVDEFGDFLGVTPRSRQPRLEVPERTRRALAPRLAAARGSARHLVGLHGGPSWRVREWTEPGWAALAERLRRELGCAVVQLGADAHTGRGAERAPRIPGALDWVGHFTLEESIAAIAGLDLLIGIDSGLLHIAGAVGTPCLGLFGAVDPALRLPPETPSAAATADPAAVPCLGCHHREPRLHTRDGCPHDIRCMRELAPDTVFAAARRLLEAVPAPRAYAT